MGQIVNMRRQMGRKSLPYDAEIEYIQSSLSQYIDTGFSPNQDTSILITILIPQDKIISRFFETRLNIWYHEYGLLNFGDNNNLLQVRYGDRNGGTKVCNKLDIDTIYTLFMDKNQVFVDGSLLCTLEYYTFQSYTNLLLFALYDGNSITYNADNIYRLYNCKIYDNGSLIRDFIPVRIGQVGYLYDKVSGQLFCNAGTGNFILGPDVNPTVVGG